MPSDPPVRHGSPAPCPIPHCHRARRDTRGLLPPNGSRGEFAGGRLVGLGRSPVRDRTGHPGNRRQTAPHAGLAGGRLCIERWEAWTRPGLARSWRHRSSERRAVAYRPGQAKRSGSTERHVPPKEIPAELTGIRGQIAIGGRVVPTSANRLQSDQSPNDDIQPGWLLSREDCPSQETLAGLAVAGPLPRS